MSSPLIAVDIGNSRMKLGLFEAAAADRLPSPAQTLAVSLASANLEAITDWLDNREPCHCRWYIASVNRPGTTLLVDWLWERNAPGQITLLACGDLPLVVDLPRPDMVGIDRLVAAVAVNRLRAPGSPAVIVDLGSAITVDFVSSEGAFQGGAILPGIAMCARALHEFTDLLPLLDMQALSTPPPSVGTSTVEAMRSGIFWGAVGGVRELVARMRANGMCDLEVFCSGGSADQHVATLLADSAQYIPHLTLAGIAVAASG